MPLVHLNLTNGSLFSNIERKKIKKEKKKNWPALKEDLIVGLTCNQPSQPQSKPLIKHLTHWISDKHASTQQL